VLNFLDQWYQSTSHFIQSSLSLVCPQIRDQVIGTWVFMVFLHGIGTRDPLDYLPNHLKRSQMAEQRYSEMPLHGIRR